MKRTIAHRALNIGDIRHIRSYAIMHSTGMQTKQMGDHRLRTRWVFGDNSAVVACYSTGQWRLGIHESRLTLVQSRIDEFMPIHPNHVSAEFMQLLESTPSPYATVADSYPLAEGE